MRRILSFILLGAVMAVPAARAEHGFYIGGFVSYAMPSDSTITESSLLAPGESATLGYNQGAGVSFDVGYKMGIGRIEGEIAYQSNGINEYRDSAVTSDATGRLNQTSALLNGYLDFPTGTSITPYIGGGVGVAQVQLDDFNIAGSGVPNSSSTDTVNVFQVSLGGASRVNEHFDLDFRYRYAITSDPSFDNAKMDLSGYLLTFGVRYKF
jgi:opacity protein-like surface antigen